MKVLKYLNINIALMLTSFSCTFAMEQGAQEAIERKQKEAKSVSGETLPKLPVGVFQELAKVGIKTSAKTEKEVFAATDKFMQAGGNSARAVMNLVKEAGIKRRQEDYAYGDFKADIMDDIIDERARQEAWKKVIERMPEAANYYALSPAEKYLEEKLILMKHDGYPENKLNIALKAEATNWAKHQLKYDRKFKENLQKQLVKAFEESNIDLDLVEKLLKLGANPDVYKDWQGGLDFITTWRILNFYDELSYDYPKQLEILELFLKNGANPNIKSKGVHSDIGSRFSNPSFPNYPLHRALIWSTPSQGISDKGFKDRLNVIKLLIKYGANPNLKDNKGSFPVDYAKNILKELQGTVGYYSGYGKEDEKVKTVKEIIKMLEEAMAKQPKVKKTNKDEQPFIGIM